MVPVPTGADVAGFLGRAADTDLVTLAGVHAGILREFARSYTRGQGFTADGLSVEPDLRAAIITAAARSAVNPSQQAVEGDDSYTARASAVGAWSLQEIQTLNGYRRRTA